MPEQSTRAEVFQDFCNALVSTTDKFQDALDEENRLSVPDIIAAMESVKLGVWIQHLEYGGKSLGRLLQEPPGD